MGRLLLTCWRYSSCCVRYSCSDKQRGHNEEGGRQCAPPCHTHSLDMPLRLEEPQVAPEAAEGPAVAAWSPNTKIPCPSLWTYCIVLFGCDQGPSLSTHPLTSGHAELGSLTDKLNIHHQGGRSPPLSALTDTLYMFHHGPLTSLIALKTCLICFTMARSPP